MAATILLTGGTGFLGDKVLEALVSKQYQVRVVTRGSDDWRDSCAARIRKLGAEAVLADLRDAGRLAKAVEGCNIVVNVAGILHQDRDNTFEAVHVEGVRNLVAAAEVFGVQRFIHVSCLGSGPREDSECYRTKWEGEELVRKGAFHWTVLRPGFLFGERCRLVEMLQPLLKAPMVPIIGSGVNRLQPVSVDDVAACVVQSIFDRETAGKVYDLAGPQVYSLAELMQMLIALSGKSKPTVNVPTAVAMKAGGFTGMFIPKLALDSDAVAMLVSDSVADTLPMRGTFQVEFKPFEPALKAMFDGAPGSQGRD